MNLRTFLKSTLVVLTAGILANVALLSAKDDHDHDHEHSKVGPTGGRVLTKFEPHAEFFINKDQKVEIRFLDEDLKVIAPAEQVISVTLGERSKPTKLSFTKTDNVFTSDSQIPEGKVLPTVIQIREKAGAKATTERFNLNLNECPECKHLEYVCTCEHDHDDHDHKHDKKK